jgi:hypothetical protein
MNIRAQQTMVRTSLSRESVLVLALHNLRIGGALLALYSVAQTQAPRMTGCGGRWVTATVVVHPLSAFVAGLGSGKTVSAGSSAAWLRWRPAQRTFTGEHVSIERHFSRIFPAFPRSLASVLIPRPAALAVLLRTACALRVWVSKQKSPAQQTRGCGPECGRDFSSEPPQKARLRPWERGTLASLRARVSRGNFGQIQTGEKQWHSTKTKSR